MRSAGCRKSTGELAAVYHETRSVWGEGLPGLLSVACQSTGCTCGITIQNLLGDMGYVVRVVGHTKYIWEFGNVKLYTDPPVMIE